MPNLKLEIEYDGTNYSGWQVQHPRKNQKTLQDTIEKVLRQVLQERVKLIAAGRTDAGVHALAQVANFSTRSGIPLEKLQQGLNSLLSPDIVIKKIKKVAWDFHSRFHAKSKVYRYSILNRAYPAAITRNSVYHYNLVLDLKLMQREARVLLGRHDFSSFAASASKKRNPVKNIKAIKVAKNRDCINIEIEADGFLYNMARNIVGTLIEIGRGKLPQGSMKRILAGRNRRLAGPTAPARGLCLIKVNY